MVTQAAPLRTGTELDSQGHTRSLMNLRSVAGHPHSQRRNCRPMRDGTDHGAQGAAGSAGAGQCTFLMEVSGSLGCVPRPCESGG